MFLLTPERSRCERALSKLHSALDDLARGPVTTIPVGESWFGWFGGRQSDNLHVFSNALVVGKLTPGEPVAAQPISHRGEAPPDVHPLVPATRIEAIRESGGVRVRPYNTTNIFYDSDSASDMQLLIADAKGYRPSPEGVAMLGTVGYFPADLTLFSEIERIPLFHALDLGFRRLERVGRFESGAADDAAFVDRLVSIIPADRRSVLAVSGGCDSRFILAVLKKAGVRPELIRLSDAEDSLVERLAAELGLPLTVVREPAEDPPPLRYTLMTDAQIYFRGGHYARLRKAIPAGALYYTGLYANSVLKNALRASWKVPRLRRDMTTRLIEHGLLARMRPTEPGLVAAAEKELLLRFLREHLAATPPSGTLSSSKEFAAWFYYVHKATRWIPAHLGDLSFFGEPVHPLSDLRALELAIRTSAWANFGNDRVRCLNDRLLPSVAVEYSGGQRRLPRRGPRRGFDKLAYEYGSRALVYLRDSAAERSGESHHLTPDVAAQEESAGFRTYFDRGFAELATGRRASTYLRRAAVTVNSALLYLSGTIRDAGARADEAPVSIGGSR
jgi:hypothetical protein